MRWVRILLVMAALSVCDAAAREYRPGESFALQPGDGLLAIDIDAVAPISAVKIERIGSLFGGTTLTGLRGGTTIRLVELPAGEYRWARVDLARNGQYLSVHDDARFRFRIEAGAVNYPGDLCVTPTGNSKRYAVTVTNRAARLLVHLDREYPGARRKYPLRFQGAFPDRFLQFAADQLGDELASDALKAGSAGTVDASGSDSALQAQVGELFARPQVRVVRLNPRGDLIAMVEFRDGKHRVSLVDAQSQVAVDVYQGADEVRKVYFAGDHTLLIELDLPGGNDNYIVHVDTRAGSAPAFTQHVIPGRGWFIDPVISDGTQALYAHVGNDGTTHIFRIALTGQRFDSSQFSDDRRLDKGLDQAFFGLADADGNLRYALTAIDGDYAVMYRAGPDDAWRQVERYAADEVFQPVMLSDDARSVVALINKGRAQVDLVRIALPGGQVIETLYSIPGIDLGGVLTRNQDRQVLGVLAWRDGRLVTHYLEQPDDALLRAVARALPGKNIVIYDSDAARNRMLVLASDEVDPGVFYVYDHAASSVQQLVSIHAPMPHVQLVHSQILRVAARDGTPIESYLTLPPGARAPYPLIVMPHGGPIGIRDNLTFDPEVQLLANRGYAVLRVIPGGSGVCGRAFARAGLGAWGTTIEDDILTALDAALKAAPLDRDRIALRGASYGGYSTLIGLIRTPERFRCGVALSAVTDVPLLFTSSDWSQDERARVRMMQVVGDPAAELGDMEAVSPDYQYRKLNRPLLVIHGARDTRVPLEHALRLLLLLGHARQPPQSLFFAHEGHGLEDPEARLQAESAIDHFYGQCMAPRGSATAAVP